MKTSGKIILTRSRSEASEIVDKLGGNRFPSYIFLQLLEAHIEYSKDYCTRCHCTGSLWQYDPESDNLTSQTCPCSSFKRKDKQVSQRTTDAHIPDRYLGADIDKWQNPGTTIEQKKSNLETIAVLTSYVNSIERMKKRGYGIFLSGPNGVGKTYLACAIAIAAIRGNYDVCYYTMPKIIRTIFDGWYGEAGSKQTVVNDIEESDFLVIDDIDKAYRTKTQIEVTMLDNLFRERLQNNRPVIITSNRTMEQMRESHTQSIYSMFMEHCAECVIVGSDYRKTIAKSIATDILEGG